MTTITETKFKRLVVPGSYKPEWHHSSIKVWIEIEYQCERNDHWELSICGVEGPMRNGNCVGGCGQCIDALDRITNYSPGWTPEMVAELKRVWERWHLNGMRAGSPAQEEWLRGHEWPGYPVEHYGWAKAGLAAAGLQPDPNFCDPRQTRDRIVCRGSAVTGDAEVVRIPVADVPYSYGSAWLYEPVPEEVLTWLRDLPRGTTAHYPWSNSY